MRVVDVAMWRYGGIEIWRHAATSGIQGMEVWSAGDALQVCRRADVEAWSYGALELWRRAAGVATGRYGGMEVWRLDVGVATWRHWRHSVLGDAL